LTTIPENLQGNLLGSTRFNELQQMIKNGSMKFDSPEYKENDSLVKQATNKKFETGHFDEPNVLAHMRVDNRMITGKKTLMVEEIQSDWHQKGRRQGYQSGKDVEKQYENLMLDMKKQIYDEGVARYTKEYQEEPKLRELMHNIPVDEFADRAAKTHISNMKFDDLAREAGKYDEWKKLYDELAVERNGVPNAPFKKNWHELMMKQIINEAVKGNYDAIAFTTGKQQNERYNLAKYLDEIYYKKNDDGTYTVSAIDKNHRQHMGDSYTPEQIEEHLGKDMAKKIVDDTGKTIERSDSKSISGEGLSIGGEGMKGFYDKILPDFINKYTKKYGMGTKKANLPKDNLYNDFKDWVNETNPSLHESFINHSYTKKDDLFQEWEKSGKKLGEEVHFVELTDAAKKDIKSKGQPLFSGIGLAAPALMMEDQDKTKK
jgi:hypothetical protein